MSDMSRKEAIEILKYQHNYGQMEQSVHDALGLAIASLETDEAYQLEYERTTKKDLVIGVEDLANYKDADGNCLDDLILEVLQENFDCGNTYGYKVADAIIELLPSVYPKSDNSENVTLKFSKGTLKFSCKDYVVYKKDWFRSHYGAEIDIMCGDKQYLSDNSVLDKCFDCGVNLLAKTKTNSVLEDIKDDIKNIGYKELDNDIVVSAIVSVDDVIDIIDRHISGKEQHEEVGRTLRENE